MFNKVAKQAIAVERECGKLKSPRGQKLAAEPYQSAADALARFDAKGRARLRQVLDAGGPGLDRTNFVLRKMVAAVLSPNYPYPPADPAKLRHLGVSDAALAELANIGATPAQLSATPRALRAGSVGPPRLSASAPSCARGSPTSMARRTFCSLTWTPPAAC